MSVAILVPVLDRPHRVPAVIANVAQTTQSPYRLLFIANEDDTAEVTALRACQADVLVVSSDRRSWACKINDGLNATTEEWVFTGADDLCFHDGWFERAMQWVKDGIHVVGTNDIANPRVMSGTHSTHTLFRRSYVETFGTIDEPGKVMHEGYRHDFTDDEAVETAKARGVYAHAFDAIVEHLHPMVGKAPDDATYRKGRQFSTDGRRLFAKRKVLWSDERLVRSAMLPAPERAVVVTATYGNYDASLFPPMPQDVPTDYVCITDNADLEVPAPWRLVVQNAVCPDNPRLSAKVPKMLPEVGCDDVVWIDASHEITSPSFVREALAARHHGFAAFVHPRRDCVYKELSALLGSENQNGLYFHRPLKEQEAAYRAEGHPDRAGLYACGVVAWDLRDERARVLGQAWLDETAKWSHQDQVELPVVCRRLGIEPGTFPVAQLEPRLSRGKRFLANRWLRIHPHVIAEPQTMKVSVLIPFSSEDKDRQTSLKFVSAHYAALGWEIVLGSCEGEWSKGTALADAFTRATHDVLVIADGDCVPDNAALLQAVRQVAQGVPWVAPHRNVVRLSQQVSARVMAGHPLRSQSQTRGSAVVGGGVVVCSRSAWQRSGGIDPRFVGWGGEDISFGWALETMCGPGVVGDGKLSHLWHTPQSPRMGSVESQALAGRYRQARGDEAAMTALIEEAKATV